MHQWERGREIAAARRWNDGERLPQSPLSQFTNGSSERSIGISVDIKALSSTSDFPARQESVGSADAVWDAGLSYTVSSAPTVAQPVITPAAGTFDRPVTVASVVRRRGRRFIIRLMERRRR